MRKAAMVKVKGLVRVEVERGGGGGGGGDADNDRDWSRTSGTRVGTVSEPCREHGTGSGPSSSVPARNRSGPLSAIPARNLSADEHF